MTSVYDVFVKLSMVNAVSPMLAIISKEVLGLDVSVKNLTKQFNAMSAGAKIALGGVGIVAGVGLIDMLAKVSDGSKDLLDQQDKLIRSGTPLNDVLKIQAQYYNDVAKAIPTSKASEYLKTVNELRAVTGSLAGAQGLAPTAMKVDTLLGNTFGRDASGEYYKLLRSAEMKGIATDPAKLADYTNKVFSYITAFGGKLTVDDFQTMARRGGTAFMNTDIDKALGPLSVLAADVGGSAAGTSLMTLQQLQMGTMTLSKQQGQMFDELGLIDMSKVSKTGFGGSRMQLKPGALKGSLSHMGDLPGWIRDVVYPALVEKSGGDEAVLQNLIGKIAPNRNAAKLIEMFGNPHFLDQQQKDLGLAGQVVPIDQAYQNFITNNPMGVKRAYNEQYDSMMQAIGTPVMQAAIPVMKGVTEMFTNIGKFANANPTAVKIMAEAVAALGAALVVAGSAAVLAGAASLAAGAAIPVAIAGITAAIVAIAALNWDSAQAVLNSIVSGLTFFINQINATLGDLKSIFSWGMPGSIHGVTPGSRVPNSGQAPQWQAPGPGGRGVPNIGKPEKQSSLINHNHFYVDGHEVAMATERRLVGQGTFSTRAPGYDPYSMFQTG